MIWKSCAQKTWSYTTFSCTQSLKLPLWLSCWDLMFRWKEVPEEQPSLQSGQMEASTQSRTGLQYHAVEVFLSTWDWEAAGGWRKADWSKPQRWKSLNPIRRAQDLRLGPRFILLQNNDWAHSQDNTGVAEGQIRVLEWPHQKSLLKPDRTSLIGPENGCADLTWGSMGRQNIPKSRCVEPVASYSRSLKAVTAARGASTKSWGETLNAHVNSLIFLY